MWSIQFQVAAAKKSTQCADVFPNPSPQLCQHVSIPFAMALFAYVGVLELVRVLFERTEHILLFSCADLFVGLHFLRSTVLCSLE